MTFGSPEPGDTTTTVVGGADQGDAWSAPSATSAEGADAMERLAIGTHGRRHHRDRLGRGEGVAAGRPRRFGRRRRHWFRRGVALVLLILVAYVGATFVQVWRAASTQDHGPSAEAIVVLGAAQYDGRVSPALRLRLDHALDLYQRDVAPVIVVTGGRQVGDRFTEATAGYNYLRDRQVPDSALRKEVQGRTTYESLASTARFLDREGIDDVVLISGPAQSQRLAGIAADVGLQATVSPPAGSASLRALARETLAVSLGRITGYSRLERFDH